MATTQQRRKVRMKRGAYSRTPTRRIGVTLKAETLADLEQRSAETEYTPSTLARLVIERGVAMGLLGDRALRFTVPFTHGREGVEEVVVAPASTSRPAGFN